MKLLTVLAVCLLFLPPAAHADWSYPGQSAAPAVFQHLQRLGDRYWFGQPGTERCVNDVQVYVVPDAVIPGAWAMGYHEGSQCAIWVSKSMQSFIGGYGMMRSAARKVCAAMFHEDGHARGLPHTAPGIKSVMAPLAADNVVPRPCFAWATQFTESLLRADKFHRYDWDIFMD